MPNEKVIDVINTSRVKQRSIQCWSNIVQMLYKCFVFAEWSRSVVLVVMICSIGLLVMMLGDKMLAQPGPATMASQTKHIFYLTFS